MTADVQRHPGIIPEPGVQQLHSSPADDIFQDSWDKNGDQIRLEPVCPNGLNE